MVARLAVILIDAYFAGYSFFIIMRHIEDATVLLMVAHVFWILRLCMFIQLVAVSGVSERLCWQIG